VIVNRKIVFCTKRIYSNRESECSNMYITAAVSERAYSLHNSTFLTKFY